MAPTKKNDRKHRTAAMDVAAMQAWLEQLIGKGSSVVGASIYEMVFIPWAYI